MRLRGGLVAAALALAVGPHRGATASKAGKEKAVGEYLGRTFCTGERKSKDVIVYLGQKTHSTYDATHKNTLNASMESLKVNMHKVGEADVIIWHEGDLAPEDATALNGVTNVRMCLLTKETGWGLPPWLTVVPESRYSAGYRYMIRFYAVTIWPTLKHLGYDWVMRMDDDSFIHSPVPYNIFQDMRDRNLLYGYRMLSKECPTIFGDFVEGFVSHSRSKTMIDAAEHRHRATHGQRRRRELLESASSSTANNISTEEDPDERELDEESKRIITFCGTWPRHCRQESQREKLAAALAKSVALNNGKLDGVPLSEKYHGPFKKYKQTQAWYCPGPGHLGYYNNWFVTKISWWLENAHTARMIEAFDRSNLIFTRRLNDLIFQTAVIKLFMGPEKRKRYTDFTYQHHTVSGGIVTFGGIETGTADPNPEANLQRYLEKHIPEPQRRDSDIETCQVQETFGGDIATIKYISPAQMHRRRDGDNAQLAPFESPYCDESKATLLW